MPPATDPRRILAFSAIVSAAVLMVVVYARYVRSHEASAALHAKSAVDDAATLSTVRVRPHLLFRSTALGPAYGHLAIVPLDAPEGKRYVTGLSCDRVHATAMAGLCLSAARGVFTTYRADEFDRDFKVVREFPLEGVPSRTRVAADGSLAVATVFVSGDSYAVDSFSTRTTLFDLRAGRLLANLEEFTVEMDGRPLKRPDFNFWGVTFSADPDRFYAVLASARRLHLVEGQVSTRRIRIIREGIECPSLSPDGQRIAFKARMPGNTRLVWQLHVLNLRTNAEAVVNESRSVDDQAEWLDGNHVLYSLPREANGDGSSDVWVAPADGVGKSRLLVADAFSPAVVRP